MSELPRPESLYRLDDCFRVLSLIYFMILANLLPQVDESPYASEMVEQSEMMGAYGKKPIACVLLCENIKVL